MWSACEYPILCASEEIFCLSALQSSLVSVKEGRVSRPYSLWSFGKCDAGFTLRHYLADYEKYFRELRTGAKTLCQVADLHRDLNGIIVICIPICIFQSNDKTSYTLLCSNLFGISYQ